MILVFPGIFFHSVSVNEIRKAEILDNVAVRGPLPSCSQNAQLDHFPEELFQFVRTARFTESTPKCPLEITNRPILFRSRPDR